MATTSHRSAHIQRSRRSISVKVRTMVVSNLLFGDRRVSTTKVVDPARYLRQMRAPFELDSLQLHSLGQKESS
jgi:hypothetical protein